MAEAPHQRWSIEKLDRSVHDRASFDCGKQLLNDWIRRLAGQYENRDLARVYVAVRQGDPAVCGFYSLSSHRVSFESLPHDQAKGLPTRISIPAVLLGQLAVDRHEQGHGLGELLLLDALHRTDRLADRVGIRVIVVDAADEDARGFYLKYGFTSLEDDRSHLVMPVTVVRRLRSG